jgi:hypothetical protein
MPGGIGLANGSRSVLFVHLSPKSDAFGHVICPPPVNGATAYVIRLAK